MARKDIFHESLKNALLKDDWIITDDPLDLTIGEVELLADFGAERIIAAEKANQKIAIELKSFIGQSPVSEFHKALGQYSNYRLSLEELEPERTVWLAIPQMAWEEFFQRPFIQKSIQRYKIEILVFDPQNEILLRWIK